MDQRRQCMSTYFVCRGNAYRGVLDRWLGATGIVYCVVGALLIVGLRGAGLHELPVGYPAARSGVRGDLSGAVCLALAISEGPASAAAGDMARLVAVVSADGRVGGGEADLEQLAAWAGRRSGREYVADAHGAQLPLLDAAAAGLYELVCGEISGVVSKALGRVRAH